MKPSSILQYRKDPRLIVTVPLLLVTATSLVYYFIQRAKELSPEALSSRLLLFVLLNINLILILGILFVLVRGVVKLLLERKRGILGSHFRSKLVATYVITSLIPVGLLFVIATDLLRVSIDRWFNTPVRVLLDNSAKIAQASQDRMLREAEAAAREIAVTVDARGPRAVDETINHVRRFHTVDIAGIYQNGVVMKIVADPRAPIHEVGEPPTRFFAEVAEKGGAQKLDVGPHGKWARYGVALKSDPTLVAVAGVFIPSAVSRMIDENVIEQKNFEQLDSQRPALKASQTSLFLTVTLSILFMTLWTSIYASRRITVPLRALAEGTKALSEGGYGHRIEVEATDDFGVLIDSFNRMSSQLESQRTALTESNTEMQTVNRRLDEERAYLSTVLESVSTGIIAFTADFKLLSINRAAMEILQIPQPEPERGARLDAILNRDAATLSKYLTSLKDRDQRPRAMTVIRGGELRYLEISAARLDRGAGKAGWVVAIEDSTQLVQAQKLAAWSEAARRIAHEIKNPLTPIQLSAERIAKKFRQGDPDIATAVEDGCRTIVSEVGQLKSMVDEFSRFARMPAIHPRRMSLGEVFRDVALLYRDVKPGVSVVVDLDDAIEALIDPEQIRRAMINLLDNAIAATDRGDIRISARTVGRRVVVDVADPGRGVPDEDKEKLFLPYFSTKGEGTGLGLAIVHRIIDDHDGRITVHDNHPSGTRFEIELPA